MGKVAKVSVICNVLAASSHPANCLFVLINRSLQMFAGLNIFLLRDQITLAGVGNAHPGGKNDQAFANSLWNIPLNKSRFVYFFFYQNLHLKSR